MPFFHGLFLFSALAAAAPPTFHRDVLPVLQARCQSCHRPGEVAPMPLLTYQQARPWAKAMKTAVLARKMPPWGADPAVGHFVNDRRLSQEEMNTISAWADGGAPEGKAKDAPPPREFTTGWNIGTPDKVYEMPNAFSVPAEGVLDYQWIRLPSGFTEGTWIRGIEVRPGVRSVVHHVGLFYRAKESKWMADAPIGVPVPHGGGLGESGGSNGLVAEYVPGLGAQPFPEGSAIFLPAGCDFMLQLHYTPTGKAAEDRTKVGVIFAKEPPKMRYMPFGITTQRFVIPAGAPDTKVDANWTMGADIRIFDLQPHMHLRGKTWEFRAVYPDGKTEVLLRVPKYDFNWQHSYHLPPDKVFPKGTRIEAEAHYDNSANNPKNPDPSKEVRHGLQTTDEMMAGVMHLLLPVDFDMRQLMGRPSNYQRSGPGQ